MTLAHLRELGTPRQWLADLLAGLTVVAFSVLAFWALGVFQIAFS